MLLASDSLVKGSRVLLVLSQIGAVTLCTSVSCLPVHGLHFLFYILGLWLTDLNKQRVLILKLQASMLQKENCSFYVRYKS